MENSGDPDQMASLEAKPSYVDLVFSKKDKSRF